IFIIATNYKERLDSAVVRRGRIDEEFCIPPPDRRARRQLFTMQLKRLAPVGSTVPKDGLLIERLADLTPGWVFKEIENLAYIAGTIDDSARKQLLDDLKLLKGYQQEVLRTGAKEEVAEPMIDARTWTTRDLKRGLDPRE